MSVERQRFEGKYEDEGVLQLFEEQYNSPDVIEVGKEEIEVVDLNPPEKKTETPTILVPGWAATADVLKENALTLAKLGRRVVVASAVHGVETEPQEVYPDAEMRKTEALMQSLDHKGIERADAVSHSEGGMFMTIGAMEHNDRFRNLVLVSPAGLIGKDSWARLGPAFTRDISEQTIKALFQDRSRFGKMWKAYTEFGKATAQDPVQALREIQAMVDYRIEDLLREMKSRGHGVSIIHGVHDRAFPMERMQKIVDETMLDGFVSVKGSHNELYLKPHPMSELVDHLLDAMEKKPFRQTGAEPASE